jgi:hypothetical protein
VYQPIYAKFGVNVFSTPSTVLNLLLTSVQEGNCVLILIEIEMDRSTTRSFQVIDVCGERTMTSSLVAGS